MTRPTTTSSLWLHVDLVPRVGELIDIERDEARHAFGARRLVAGDIVTLFDGRGGLAQARLTDERTKRGDVLAEVVERTDAPPLLPEVTIAFAVPKGDRLSTLLDLTTQAGVSRLLPVDCARSVVDTDKLDRGERWSRILSESTKVAKRAWSPELVAGGRLVDVARAELARGASIAVAHTSHAIPLAVWRDALPPDCAHTAPMRQGAFRQRGHFASPQGSTCAVAVPSPTAASTSRSMDDAMSCDSETLMSRGSRRCISMKCARP